MTEHKGWHDRGYLPHLDAAGAVQHVVFRLCGSLPPAALERLRLKAQKFDLAVDQALDDGDGPNWLADPVHADIVAEALKRSDGEQYQLLAWVVMPNHAHVLIRQFEGWPLGVVVKSWKSYSARMINRRLGRTGPFWAADYFDRFMRHETQTLASIDYIERNPVKAGLCAAPEDWPWSSAGVRAARSANVDISADLEVRAPPIPFER